MMKEKILLFYGVTGYTGQLILKMAVEFGLKPVIAGRNPEKTKKLAEQYQLNYKVFELSDELQIRENIRGAFVLLNIAGPFRDTAREMASACIAEGCHYLDITGEIAIMQWMKDRDAEAKSAGIMLMCGVGFDLVPTDCVAVKLREQLPDASHLKIAFYMKGGSVSHGTMKTMVGNLGLKGYTRLGGQLLEQDLGKSGRYFPFGKERKFCISIPWGDLFSAYESTGIPNIETYTTASPLVWLLLKIQFLFNPLLRSTWFRNVMHKYIDNYVTGPSEAQNEAGKSMVYGEVSNDSGKSISTTIKVAESYKFTALASIAIAQKVLAGNYKTGYQTPAMCYGANLVYEIEGTTELR